MAHFYNKPMTGGTVSVLKTLVLDERESFVQPLGFSDWNELKVAISISPISLLDDNVGVFDYSGHSFLMSTIRDTFMFGLKYSNNIFPGENGECFVGIKGVTGQNLQYASYTGMSETQTLTVQSAISSGLGNGIWNDLAVASRSYSINSNNGPSNFCNVLCLKFVLVNRGLPNQSIRVTLYPRLSGGEIHTTKNGLTQTLPTFTSGSETVEVPFNISGIPMKLPNAIFFNFCNDYLRFRINSSCVSRLS